MVLRIATSPSGWRLQSSIRPVRHDLAFSRVYICTPARPSRGPPARLGQTAGGELSKELSELSAEDDYVGPVPASLIERSDERTTLTYKARPFTVATRLNDCDGVLRSVYAVHGRTGLDTFFGENDFVPKRIGAGKEVEYIEPEQVLGPRVHLYRLFREANRYLRARA